jgi:hypothetical protein
MQKASYSLSSLDSTSAVNYFPLVLTGADLFCFSLKLNL